MSLDPGHDDDKLDADAPACETCGGTGTIDIGDCEDGVTDECPACNGTGKQQEED